MKKAVTHSKKMKVLLSEEQWRLGVGKSKYHILTDSLELLLCLCPEHPTFLNFYVSQPITQRDPEQAYTYPQSQQHL